MRRAWMPRQKKREGSGSRRMGRSRGARGCSRRGWRSELGLRRSQLSIGCGVLAVVSGERGGVRGGMMGWM